VHVAIEFEKLVKSLAASLVDLEERDALDSCLPAVRP